MNLPTCGRILVVVSICGVIAACDRDVPNGPGGARGAIGTQTTAAADASPVEPAAAAGASARCPASTPPARVRTQVVVPSRPVVVPDRFMGMHLGLNQPQWISSSRAAIPAPAYPYDYARTLKADVDGQEERGFWSNIETSPGVYDWSYMDKWMNANAGHPVVWLIYATPVFYQKYPGEPSRWPSWPGIASPPTDAGHVALKNYARAAKARYGSQIAAFEVWNEPTLPWTGGATSHGDRWTPSWGQANAPQDPAPFFSGSASDLANIAYTLNTAGLGVPILGAGFVDQWKAGQHTVTRFLNAPVTLPGGGGTGKDHVQALSIHFYDYGFDPAMLIAVVDGYRTKLGAAGLPRLPIWGTETGAEFKGVFSANDARAPVNVQRWVLLAAAKGMNSLILYGHVSGTDALRLLGDPIGNAGMIAALTRAYGIRGSVICSAAVLVDDRVWVTTLEGENYAI